MILRLGRMSALILLFGAMSAAGSKEASEPDSSAPPRVVANDKKSSPDKFGIKWVSIPGGSFTMGSDDFPSAKPVHRVTVKPFQIAKTLVTNKQYKACVDAGACPPAPASCGHPGLRGDDQPMVCVSWKQAKVFSKWVGGRLPTEAEWEYAARSAGKDYKYPWGNAEATCERAVIPDGSAGGDGCGRKSTLPVCSKPAGNTEQGLCDMAGNVWEWTQDWYHDSYKGAPTDGSAWDKPASPYRVMRGGAWARCEGHSCTEVASTQAAYRSGTPPDDQCIHSGFRPSRSL